MFLPTDTRFKTGIGKKLSLNYSPQHCCGSGIRCLFDPLIRDPEWVKNHDLARPGIQSGMNIPDHITESLETKFLGNKFFDADPGSGIFLNLDPGSGMEKFGSELHIPDPQH